MKMIKNIKFWMASLMLLSMGAASCIEEGTDQLSGKGINEFRIESAEFDLVTFLPDTPDQTKAFLRIYRDANSTSAMDKEASFTLEINTDSLDAYNARNGTSLVLLDPTKYTLSVPLGTVTFEPNEGVKTIEITLNTTGLDLGLAHVVPFVIKDAADGYSINPYQARSIIQTLPINKYDGEYEVSGTVVDVVVPTIDGSCAYPFTGEIHTSGASQVYLFDPGFGDYYSRICSGGGVSRYGGCGLQIDFDVNDDIASVTNMQYDPLPRGRYYVLNPAGLNKYDPATGTIYVTFDMRYFVSGVDTYRTTFDLTLTYNGPR